MNIASQFATYRDSFGSSVIDEFSLLGVILIYVFVLFIWIGVYALYAYMLSRIFKKAGIATWIAWVPFYNIWKCMQLGGQAGFWSILLFIPFANIVAFIFFYAAQYRIGLNLGKEGWWVVIAIFAPIVWFALLAFDSSRWKFDEVRRI